MRLIDIDFLISEIKSHNDMNDRSMSWATWQVIELLKNCPMPPNDPLTLEEMRGMDGEPVWVECLGTKDYSAWTIVDICLNGIHTKYFYADFDYYGVEWLAYRRKPEENT